MHSFRLPFIFLLILCCAGKLAAQLPSTPEGLKQPRILILMDGSSSMLNPWSKDMVRFGAAGKVVATLMDSIYRVNNQVEFALRVYGHQYPAQENNCTDTRREVMFSKDNYTQMTLRMASLHPRGVSPIAFALKEAAVNDLEDELHNAYSIILITDGGESCNGNICDVVKTLIDRKIFFKPYIISLAEAPGQREQYACLGSFLPVTQPADIPKTVATIVNDYRPMLKAPILVSTKPAPRSNVQTIEIPKWVPEHSDVSTVSISIKDRAPQMVSQPARSLAPQISSQVSLPVIEPVFTPEHTELSRLTIATMRKLPETYHYNRILRSRFSPDMPMATITSVFEFEPERLPVLRPATRRLLSQTLQLPPLRLELQSDLEVTKVRIPAPEPVPVVQQPVVPAPVIPKAAPPREPAPSKTTVVIKDIPATRSSEPVKKAEPDKPKEIAFTSSSESSAQPGTMIYFTDGHGKFYKTTPRLQLVDAKGTVVKQFFRTIDAAGNPDLLQLPGGTYSLVVPGRRNSMLRNVTIQADKMNKIVAVVSNGSLAFEYEGSPGKPVAEFEAIVNILFEPGPTIRQKCSVELEYTPGNYHVEINTLPVSKYNVDIDFANTSVLPVKMPGYVQFTNTTPIGKIALYNPVGDRFVRFFIMDLNGNPANQKLRLQPGAYEVHWVKGPGELRTESVQRFLIKSNAITEIEL